VMAPRIRPARHEDVVRITPWTSNTFEWGDYIPTRLTDWIDDADSEVLIYADEDDTPIALVHVVMLSPTEGWLEGARVHPEHRRRGLGKALNDAGMEWAAARGARVVRLTTETDNSAARNQVENLGYREVSRWVYAEYEVDQTHRAPDQFRLRPAPGSDAEAAWLFWVASDLARLSRELIAIGWQWRMARPEDITSAVGEGELFQSPAGWVRVRQTAPDWLHTLWIATTPEDVLLLLDGLLDMAAERKAAELYVKLPDLGWTAEAITRTGAEPKGILVYAKPVY
jgi:ribosomal protein S18 acetylase RimI-like enzyme